MFFLGLLSEAKDSPSAAIIECGRAAVKVKKSSDFREEVPHGLCMAP
jgi:hypothetical protein